MQNLHSSIVVLIMKYAAFSIKPRRLKCTTYILFLLNFLPQAAVALGQGDRFNIDPSISACPYDLENSDAEIEVAIAMPDLSQSGGVNTSYRLSQIRALSGEKNSLAPDKVVAFADVEFEFGYVYATRYFKLPEQDIECHWIEKIDFSLRFSKPPTIFFPAELYAARDEDGGVCFDQIMAHEREHIRDFETVFEKTIAQLRQYGRLLPDSSLPSRFRSLAVPSDGVDSKRLMEEIISDYYAPIIAPIVEEMQAELARLGEALDSSAEYERITRLCEPMIEYIQ